MCSKFMLVLGLVSAAVTLLSAGVALYLMSRDGCGETRRILVDSDGGADDAMALALLATARCVRVVAVTVVPGLAGPRNASRNLLALLDVLRVNYEIEVFAGEDVEPVSKEEGYYGWDGFGDFLPPASNQTGYTRSVSDVIVKTLTRYPDEIVLLCIGPLTNLAQALRSQPDLLELTKQTIVVGASYQGGGNVGPGMEFNMAVDPAAASYVFRAAEHSSKPVTVIPLETVESEASFTMEWRKELGDIRSEKMEFFNKAERKALAEDTTWSCFDQSGAAVAVEPEAAVDLLRGGLVIGDKGEAAFHPQSTRPNVQIVTSLDTQYLLDLLITSLL